MCKNYPKLLNFIRLAGVLVFYGVFFLLEMEQRMLLQINEVNVSP